MNSILLVIIGALALLVFLGVFAVWMEYRRKPAQRGFEVKLNTGEEPVTEKKENDHG